MFNQATVSIHFYISIYTHFGIGLFQFIHKMFIDCVMVTLIQQQFLVTGHAILQLIDYIGKFCLDLFEKNLLYTCNDSMVIREKGESQNGCFKKTKYAKFSEKQKFFTP